MLREMFRFEATNDVPCASPVFWRVVVYYFFGGSARSKC
jgi:hypothetical protein